MEPEIYDDREEVPARGSGDWEQNICLWWGGGLGQVGRLQVVDFSLNFIRETSKI